MPDRVLMSTFGFDAEKILRSLRWIGYDRLTLLVGGKSLKDPGLRRIEAAERAAGAGLEVVRVDPFDLRACFEAAVGAIRRHRKAGHEVRVNVSGGTKILADAALLAAFQEGVEAWHCEDRPVRLPVLKGVTFSDAFTATERAVLSSLRRPVPVSALVARLVALGHGEASVRSSIARLHAQGLLSMTIRAGVAVAFPNREVAWFTRTLF